MESNKEQISLANLKGGAALELFDFELQNVLENIMDPNTKAEEAIAAAHHALALWDKGEHPMQEGKE